MLKWDNFSCIILINSGFLENGLKLSLKTACSVRPCKRGGIQPTPAVGISPQGSFGSGVAARNAATAAALKRGPRNSGTGLGTNSASGGDSANGVVQLYHCC